MQNFKHIFLSIVLLIAGNSVNAQSILDHFPDINIIESNGPSKGNFIVATKSFYTENGSNYFAIFDNDGTPVYMRLLEGSAASIMEQPNGHLTLIDGSIGKVFFELDSMFNVIDTFLVDGYNTDGHDFDMDENGHVLLMGREDINIDMSTIIEGGNHNANIIDKLVQEFDADHNLLYTWKSWDHYDIFDADTASPLVDLTAKKVDYNHANSICFDSDTSFLFSVRHFNEITKIDRRTGEIIWRLGGKNNDFTFINDDVRFSHQHSIRKLPNGNIQIFDNGNMNAIQESSVVEYEIDEENMTATLINRIRHNPAIYISKQGGKQLLSNGNLLVYWGSDTPSFTEFNPDGSVALEMDFSDHSFSNKILKTEWKHTIFETDIDQIDFGMWNGDSEILNQINVKNNTDSIFTLSGYNTKTNHFQVTDSFPLSIPAGEEISLTVAFSPNSSETGYIKDVLTIQAEYPELYVAQQIRLTGKQEDLLAPSVEILPDTTNVPVDAKITVKFNEAVRLINDVELNYINVDDLFTFTKENPTGQPIPYNAIINTEKNTIIVNPLNLLEDNQLYYFGLNEGLEDYSNNLVEAKYINFNTGSTVGRTDNLRLNDKILLYPNPNNGNFKIDLDLKQQIKIEIYNMMGVLVKSKIIQSTSSSSFNISDLNPGQYIIIARSLTDNSILYSKKVVTF